MGLEGGTLETSKKLGKEAASGSKGEASMAWLGRWQRVGVFQLYLGTLTPIRARHTPCTSAGLEPLLCACSLRSCCFLSRTPFLTSSAQDVPAHP